MKFVQRKVTTAKSKHTIADFTQLKEQFLQDVVATVEMKKILPELIRNWDQTGIKIVPSNTWTMDQQGVKWVEMCGAKDKRLIMAVFVDHSLVIFYPLEATMIHYIEKIIVPYINSAWQAFQE